MLIGLTVVTLLQYIQILTHYTAHLKWIECYVSYTSIKKKLAQETSEDFQLRKKITTIMALEKLSDPTRYSVCVYKLDW